VQWITISDSQVGRITRHGPAQNFLVCYCTPKKNSDHSHYLPESDRYERREPHSGDGVQR
jgi:hypothetical protein